MQDGTQITLQAFLVPLAAAAFSGLSGGRKISYTVDGFNVVGGFFGSLLLAVYNGALGVQGFAQVIAVANFLGFDSPVAFSSNFGTNFVVANFGAAPMLVTVRGDVTQYPGA